MDTSDELMDRGRVVKEIVDKSDWSVTKISKRIGRSRSQLYNDFSNPDMDWTVILNIGRAIGHDFSGQFPDINLYRNTVSEPDSVYERRSDLDQLYAEIDRWKTEAYKNLSDANKWKDKYLELVELTGKFRPVSD